MRWRVRVRARAVLRGAVYALLGTAAGLTLAYVIATRTESGRQWLLETALGRTAGLFKGRATLRVGVLREISPSRIVAEDVALVDTSGAIVIRAQEVEGRLDISDLYDKAIHIDRIALRQVEMNFRQEFKGPWNIAYIISGDTTKGSGGSPGFGDDVRIDHLELADAVIHTSAPWAPHPVFTGAARDSVIAVRDSLHDLVRTANGLLQRRDVRIDRLVAHDVIITEPKRGPGSMQIDSLRGLVSDPPVRVTAARGAIRWTGDSLLLRFPEMSLPNSRGSAVGRLWWHQPGPLRYDVSIDADAGLADLGWIWNVLPDSGRGTARVRLQTLADANDVQYTLTGLDIEAMDSRTRGDITVISRPASLELTGVDLAFAPLQSTLLRRLSYDAIPSSVQGAFTGRLQAKVGGPLTAFKVDRLDARFVDSRVPGAVSAVRLGGFVSLGARPRAWELQVADASVDLRSVRALAPTLPAVDGRIEGGARVESADLQTADVRGIALVWTDGAGNVSRVTGSARVRYADRDPSLTIALSLDPLSASAIARVDTTFPLRGNLTGHVEARGRLSALAWSGSISPGEGRIVLGGDASLRAGAWSVEARGIVDAFDVRRWFSRDDLPSTSLDGRVALAARGTRDANGVASLATASGTVSLSQSATDERPAFDLLGTGVFDGERLRVDSATARLGGILVDARGALARDSSRVDTMNVSVRADTLEAARPTLARLGAMLQPVDSALGRSLREYAADTLRGDLSLSGYLFGSLRKMDATLALGARQVQVGAIRVGNIFGSFRATDLLRRPSFESAATADDIDGIGAIRISTANFRLDQANPDSGRLVLDVSSRDTSHLVMRGNYQRDSGSLAVLIDSLRFESGGSTWRNATPIRFVDDARGVRVDSVEIRSSGTGAFTLVADVPMEGNVFARLRLDRFPVGAAAAFTLGTPPFSGAVSGSATLGGTRVGPLIQWALEADSLGARGIHLPRVRSDGSYADRRLVARASLTDSAGGAVRAEGRLPIDLALRAMETRTLSEALDAEVVADSLRLQALGLSLSGVERARGIATGRIAIGGTFERPAAAGQINVDGLGAYIESLGIEGYDGRLAIRAVQDSLFLDEFRIRSGGRRDTIGARGSMRIARGEPATIKLDARANNFVLARRRDGTDINLSGAVSVDGPLSLPSLSGRLFIPFANLVIDPLGATTALDLGSESAREVLGANEAPIAGAPAFSLARFGRFASVSNARIDFGDEVWVRTPEANVKVSGGLDVTTSGQQLALEGEVLANRGQYRLDLSVVKRSFSVDSGRVRFYGSDAIPPTLDISATNVVRLANGEEIPVRVHIGGTTVRPVLSLSSNDPLYSAAPESEIISLLIFGAPTFALNSESQSTVQAVTGVLVPTAGGLVEGTLQRLLPVFNTIQVNTAGRQERDDLNTLFFLDNLSITAGKQLGDRTYLRVNTGVCRGSAQSASRGTQPWFGLAAEYRIATGLSAQVGVDPGTSPCTRLGGDAFARLQFGFDLFREWVF